MPTNLELKSHCASPEAARACASACGAVPGGTFIQTDTYFRVPRGRLKLRQFSDGAAELIYYERAEDTPERWSHFTREDAGNPAGLLRVLTGAFGVLALVRKRRELYLFRDARIHIDEVDGLGSFIEFEVTGGETPESVATMKDLRSAFGIREETVIKVSYSDMIIEKRISADA